MKISEKSAVVGDGGVVTAYSDDATVRSLSAFVTEQSLAIIDLENQQALAAWQIKAAASGGKPTILSLISSSFGSAIAMAAEQLYFGDNTIFDDATDTLRTVVGDKVRVVAWGAPFGMNGDLIEWWGPASTSLNDMTTGNGIDGRMTTAPGVFNNASSSSAGAVVKSGNFGPASAGSGASTIAQFQVQSVPARPTINVSLLMGLPSVSGGTWSGDIRLYEIKDATRNLLASQGLTVDNGGEYSPSPAFAAQGLLTGTVTYEVEMLRTSGAANITSTGGGSYDFNAITTG